MNAKIILVAFAGILVPLSQSATPTVAATVGAEINLTLECKGLEADLPTLGGNFDAIEQFERDSNVWFKRNVHTYYPKIGISVAEGLVKMGEAAMPKAQIDNASSTRIEFTADPKTNAIPFRRYGVINRLTGEVEVHDDLYEGGADALKWKRQWVFRCHNAQPKF